MKKPSPRLVESALLEAVQRASFGFFWDGAEKASFLARDRCTIKSAPDNDLVAVGGSGFGVMALVVAVERGWVTRKAATARLSRMLDCLAKATCYHGAFPHFLHGKTGQTIPFSRKDDGGDLVETSFLMMGLITARQYFDQPTESALRGRITQLFEEVEWDWYAQGSDVLSWHWSPNNGFAMNHHIRGWNECLITYVLAAGAPRYAIAPKVYEKGFCEGPDYRNGKTYYGVTLPLGPALSGPLFFAHYSFCGLDPHDLKDRHANYWQQNVAQVKINLGHCAQNPGKFKGYSTDCWGITASDDPNGYDAHAPGNDNGTISPTAALSSFPYAPEAAMRALRHFLKMPQLWGRYGFIDAFNETRNWRADTYLAIDQGPIVVMIENYRSGLLWKLFMAAPEVKRGLARLGFTESPSMTLDAWIEKERVHAATMMRQAIAPPIVKIRDRFFQAIKAKPGSVVASPVPAAYDPEPDYFFHWFRDSAVVMEALRLVQDVVPDASALFADFLRFNLDLQKLDGRVSPAPRAQPDFTQFLRRNLDIAHGAQIGAETRVNPDGTLDITDWPRPQHDGPALRALAILNWGVPGDDAARLLRSDLDFVRAHARLACFGIWEEERGLHYYTLLVSAAALARGADWLLRLGEDASAALARAEADTLFAALEDWWLPEQGFIRAHILDQRRAEKELDTSVILAANHAGIAPDEKLKSTRARLDDLFGALYPINRGRAAPAWGRYAGDTYYGGGAWYAATLAAAEFCYRDGDRTAGDTYLETVRSFTPESGDLSEQFDRASGAQTSARHLAWSYAAFLTAVAARRAASG